MISKYEIDKLVRSYLDVQRIHLMDVKVSGRAGRPLIQLFIDLEEEHITIDECARISREIQDLLDIQDWTPADYRLIVSSPGIGYPLKESWQFRKNIGRTIQVKDGENIMTGELISLLDSGIIEIETNGKTKSYNMNELSYAKVVVEKPKKPNMRQKRNETRNR